MSTLTMNEKLLDLDKDDPNYGTKRMKLMVEYMQHYMTTYTQQYNYQEYTDETFIRDVLYGLGVAINPQDHRGPDGFARWKETLKTQYLYVSKDSENEELKLTCKAVRALLKLVQDEENA
ncbi:hypothetical protein b3_0212 [Synechococcus phage B3]|nr:hypothetical protein b3_0212 [Synechococcus phage B3]QGT54825.1 hypothetical protein b23_0210 [Synechococcus phage B23]